MKATKIKATKIITLARMMGYDVKDGVIPLFRNCKTIKVLSKGDVLMEAFHDGAKHIFIEQPLGNIYPELGRAGMFWSIFPADSLPPPATREVIEALPKDWLHALIDKCVNYDPMTYPTGDKLLTILDEIVIPIEGEHHE